jgi:hypothetical protein
MHLKIEGQTEADRACKNWLSPRFYQLDQLERYVLGTQYDGKPNFYEPGGDVPLIDRAPNVVHSLTEAAIRQHVDFALGEGRFPEITSASTDDEEILEEAINEEQSKVLDAFVRVLMDHAEFHSAAADALSDSEGCGTTVSVVSVVDGCPEITSLRAKWCEPKFSKNGRTLESVEIRYPYIKLEQGVDKVWRAKAYLYRRTINAQSDTVYMPAEIGQKQIEPSWRVDKDKSIDHGLGFCPVVWYQFKRTAQRAADFDGRAVHASQLDELDALNLGLSQRGRAALYAGDPQVWESGVDKDDPAGGITHVGIKPAAGDTYVFGHQSGRRPARRKGAGVVWSYENIDAKAGILALPGDALDAIDMHCKDAEDKISQVLGYTKTTPESVKGALSGKALGFLFARTTAYVDTVRTDFWRGWMQPTLHMLLRVVRTLGEAVYVPGVAKVLPILEEDQTRPMWTPPRMRALWPKYFEPTAEEITQEVKAAADAKDAQLICKETAARYVAQRFGVENIEAELEKIEEEAEEHDAAMLEQGLALKTAAPGEPAKAPVEDDE